MDDLVALLRLANQIRDEKHAANLALGRLTAREHDVLQALARGLSDKEIARELQVSANTVAAHVVHILSKLGVHSRLQAVLLGIRNGVIPLE
jgi:DNA-binding NarL/FixJ family response regulator